MLMLSNFLPLVFNNLPPIIRSHHIWTLAWILAIIVYCPKIFFNKNIQYLLCYGSLLFVSLITIFHDIDRWNYILIVNEFYQISIGLSVITYFYTSKDYFHLSKLVKWTIFFLLITAVMTIISSFIDPMFARRMTGIAALSEVESHAVLGMKWLGSGSYSTAIAFMSLPPVMIYYLKNIDKSLFSKKQLLIFLTIFCFALIRMQFFSNILIAFVFTLSAVLGVKNIKFNALILGLLVTVAVLIPTNFYIGSLHFIATLFDRQSHTYEKIQDLSRSIDIGIMEDVYSSGTEIGSRGNRYLQLLDNFVQSPFLGVFFNSDSSAHGYFANYISITSTIRQVAGTHLYWMNKLTITGVIGFSIFFYIPYSHIRNRIRYFSDEYIFYFILASLSILSYGLLKGISGRDAWYTFFIIIPGMYYLSLLKK